MADISLVLNAHREALFISRTAESLSEAVAYAAHFDVSTELVLVIDRGDDAIRQAVARLDFGVFESVNILDVDNGSLSASRNDGVAAARGRYVSTHDADDLISFNYLLECYRAAEQGDEPAIVYPEWVVGFGARHFVARYRDAEHTQLSIVDTHPFISACFFPRALFELQQYRRLDSKRGEAFEDWLFNADAIANGYRPMHAFRAILFYRQNSASMMAQARQSLMQLETPHSRLFEPETYQRVLRIPLQARQAHTPVQLSYDNSRDAFFTSHTLGALTVAANRVDPGVDPRTLRHEAQSYNPGVHSVAAEAYLALCDRVQSNRYDDVFIIPYLVAGGAERYVLDVMHALGRLDPASKCLVIAGERVDSHAWLHRLAAHATFVDMHDLGMQLTESQIDRLVLRLIQACAPRARIHLKTSMFAHRFFKKYRHHVADCRVFYYRFCDDMYVEKDVIVTSGWQTSFLSDVLASIHRLVSDNTSTVQSDSRLFGASVDHWTCLPARVLCQESVGRVDRRVTRRVLWASRVTEQKRPALIALIAERLSRCEPPISIDVFGTVEAGYAGAFGLATYRGPFSDFAALDLAGYDALVYTSWFDGLPNILLEAMAVGLPVVAPDVGGIKDAVTHRESGLLVQADADDEATADRYCVALQQLYAEPELMPTLSAGGLRYIERRHGDRAFLAHVKEIFE